MRDEDNPMSYEITCKETDGIIAISQGENVIEFDSRQRDVVLDVLENGDHNLPGSSEPMNRGGIRVQRYESNEIRLEQDLGKGPTNRILTLVDKLTACLRAPILPRQC